MLYEPGPGHVSWAPDEVNAAPGVSAAFRSAGCQRWNLTVASSCSAPHVKKSGRQPLMLADTNALPLVKALLPLAWTLMVVRWWAPVHATCVLAKPVARSPSATRWDTFTVTKGFCALQVYSRGTSTAAPLASSVAGDWATMSRKSPPE